MAAVNAPLGFPPSAFHAMVLVESSPVQLAGRDDGIWRPSA